MKNTERAELLSAYLDGELAGDELDAVKKELAEDQELEREFRMISAARQTVRDRREAMRMEMPVELERSIRLALGREVEQASAPVPTILDRIIGFFRQPAIAVSMASIALVAVVALTIDRNQAGTSDSPVLMTASTVDLYNASYDNFQKVVKGEIELAMQTSDVEELKSFFRGEGVEYDVFFPEVAAELRGGVVSDHDGQKFAHLVYGVGEHLVYIFEVDEASVARNNVAMNRTVAQDLAESRWHWEERSGVGTMFVWESNNIICSAVSDLRTQDLSALFTLEKL